MQKGPCQVASELLDVPHEHCSFQIHIVYDNAQVLQLFENRRVMPLPRRAKRAWGIRHKTSGSGECCVLCCSVFAVNLNPLVAWRWSRGRVGNGYRMALERGSLNQEYMNALYQQ